MTTAATEHEHAALAGLAEHAGPKRVADDLRKQLAAIDVEKNRHVAEFHQNGRDVLPGRRDPVHVEDAVWRLGDVLKRRAKVRAQLKAVDPDFKVDESKPIEREVYEAFVAGPRAEEVRAFARRWHAAQTSQHVRLKQHAEARIGHHRNRVASGEPTDRHHAALTGAHADADVSGKILQEIGHDPAQRARQAAAVIEANGGAEALAIAVRSALQAQNRHDAATVSGAEAASLAANADAIEAMSRRVDPKSPLAASLKSKLAAAKAALNKAKLKAFEEAEASLAATLAEVAAGDERAIAGIRRLSTEVPDAFGPGFGASWDAIGLEEHQISGAFIVWARMRIGG